MFEKDQMTSKERMMCLMTGQPIDRLPVMPLTGSVAGKIMGMSNRAERESARNQADVQIKMYNRFGHDSVAIDFGSQFVGEAFGTKLSDPEFAPPFVLEWFMNDIKDVDKLDLSKLEPQNNHRVKQTYDAIEMTLEGIGNESGVGVVLVGPFTAASSIYNTEKMLRLMHKNPEALHKLLRFSTDAIKQLATLFKKLDVSFIMVDPVASGTILKRSQYQEFVKPYASEYVNHVLSMDTGICYHICGDTTSILEDMVDTGAPIISLDNRVDLSYAKSVIGSRATLVGNVDPVGVLMLGTRDDVDAAVKECFRKAIDSPRGYIPSTGCDIPSSAKVENVDQFIESAKKYGKFPINPAMYIG